MYDKNYAENKVTAISAVAATPHFAVAYVAITTAYALVIIHRLDDPSVAGAG
jgi:hypothetical protein